MKFNFISNEQELAKVCSFLASYKGIVAVDLETETVNPWRNDIVGVGLCWNPEESVYIPLKHAYNQPIDSQNALKMLKAPLENADLCMFNAAFDMEFLELRAGIRPKQPVDTQLLAYVNAKYEAYSLKFICSKEVEDLKLRSFKELMDEFGLKQTKNSIADLPISVVAEYCGRDAIATLLLYNKLYKTVQNHPIYKLEVKVLPVTMWMRKNGVLVDKEFFVAEADKLQAELEVLHKIIETQISEAAGEKVSFNISSSKQLGNALYKILRLRCDAVTATGQPKTDKMQLAKLKWKNPIVKNILSYKELQKLVSTYPKYVEHVESDGRLHASFNQGGAPTGRFSCSDPNLQNIPDKKTWEIETAVGVRKIETNMRNGFIAPEDSILLEADYSQIEARLAAGVTRDPILLNVFADGLDWHTKTAAMIFKVPIEGVTKEQRRVGKRLNFALAYGMGVNKLWGVLNEEMPVSYKDTQYFREQYVKGYSSMFYAADVIAKDAERKGGVATLFGRWVPVFQFQKKGDFKAIQEGYRMAYNGVIQGSAADIMKWSLIKAHKLIMTKYSPDDVKVVMTVHDSVVFEVKKHVPLTEFTEDLIKVTTVELKDFPKIFMEGEIGVKWGELKALKELKTQEVFVMKKGTKVGPLPPGPVEIEKRTFILELPKFDREGYYRTMKQVVSLRNLILSRPGNNRIILKIGDREEPIPFGTNVSMEDKDRIMLLVGGKFYERVS